MKILHINFNIIMYNCIKLYADKVNISENPNVIWGYLNDTMEIDNHVCLDAKVLSAIIALIKKNKSAKFIPIVSPIAIVEDSLKQNDKIDITNIDFFHDLVTYEEEIKDWEKDKYNEMNWLGYLIYKDKVNSCEWIKAPNSFKCTNNIIDDVTISNIYELSELKDDYDIIYFNLCPHFVPPKYEYIFKLFCDFFKDDEEKENNK